MNLIPSPDNKSAIPWSEANVNNFVNTGTSLTLKSKIFKFEFILFPTLEELKSKDPSSKPFINLYR